MLGTRCLVPVAMVSETFDVYSRKYVCETHAKMIASLHSHVHVNVKWH